ncbi:MAG TPA: hypothetical protein VJ600_02920 [Holophagaceae bacterium]|nr:hypothetical protein [Holophagaceae bacterium]
MLRPTLLTASAVLVAFAGQAQTPAPTVDQIIAKHLEARGGLARLKAIRTLRIQARSGSQEVPLVTEWKRPMRYRRSATFLGVTFVHAFDGTAGWTINPFAGAGGGFKEPQPMNPEELKAAALDADLDGPLVDWQAKGHRVEYLGREDMDGDPVHKLKVSLKDGDQITYYLDADTFLALKTVTKRTVRGSEEESETTFGNYAATGGVMFPHLVASGPKGSADRERVTIDEVRINEAMSDDRFSMPAKAAK